jgi:Ca2+-binding EF-hand superfamily protein
LVVVDYGALGRPAHKHVFLLPHPFLTIYILLLAISHPFDKFVEKTDEEIQESIISVGYDKYGHMEILNELVFDERVEGLSESCLELLRQLIHPDPRERMTSETFLRHPWIQGLTASWTTMGKTHNELKAFWQTRFRTEIMKKFAASLGVTGGKLSEKDLDAIFKSLDLTQNGVLELEEIQTTFRELGVSDKNIRTIFTCADLDGTGVIHFDEFRAILLSKQTTDDDGPGLNVNYLQRRFKSRILKRFGHSKTEQKLELSNLRDIFNAIDLGGDGVLDPHDIRVVLRSAGEAEDVISRIVASLDLNRDGRVSWDEFLLIMGLQEE